MGKNFGRKFIQGDRKIQHKLHKTEINFTCFMSMIAKYRDFYQIQKKHKKLNCLKLQKSTLLQKKEHLQEEKTTTRIKTHALLKVREYYSRIKIKINQITLHSPTEQFALNSAPGPSVVLFPPQGLQNACTFFVR